MPRIENDRIFKALSFVWLIFCLYATHGGAEKIEEQPHAKETSRENINANNHSARTIETTEITLSSQPTMRGEDTERKPVPVSRNA